VRILVTGSRDWTDARKVEDEIFRALYEMKTPHYEAVLLHGACPRGADAIADAYAVANGMHVIRRPAQWITPDGHLDRAAGFRRNAELVALDPDLCLAFVRRASRGASMTADLAERAGIEVRRFLA
jgi:hypothetical protein